MARGHDARVHSALPDFANAVPENLQAARRVLARVRTRGRGSGTSRPSKSRGASAVRATAHAAGSRASARATSETQRRRVGLRAGTAIWRIRFENTRENVSGPLAKKTFSTRSRLRTGTRIDDDGSRCRTPEVKCTSAPGPVCVADARPCAHTRHERLVMVARLRWGEGCMKLSELGCSAACSTSRNFLGRVGPHISLISLNAASASQREWPLSWVSSCH